MAAFRVVEGANMKNGVKWAGVLATGLCLSGCITAPAEYEVAKSRTFDVPKDAIWERAVGYFASHDIGIKTIEKVSGIISADRMYTGYSAGPQIAGFADCGRSVLELPIAAKTDLNIFVRTLPDGKTNVSVNTNFSETRRFGNSPPTEVSCHSTGKLETEILDQLGAGS